MNIVDLCKEFAAILGTSARRRAVSLIEGVLYLVIALAVIIGGIVFFQQSQLSNAVTDTARAAVGISSQARALYQNQTGFGDNEDLTLAMIRAGAVPSSFIDKTSDAITHPFGGGDVKITGTGKILVITYSDISKEACLRLANIDEVGTGPMGTGIVGLTLSTDGPIDVTSSPDFTGVVSAQNIANTCAGDTDMAVYYSQNIGVKYAGTSDDGSGSDPVTALAVNTDNPWGYPITTPLHRTQCGLRPSRYDEVLIWESCSRDWGTAAYGNMRGELYDVCFGQSPTTYGRDMTIPNAQNLLRQAQKSWDGCRIAWWIFNRAYQ